MHSLNFKEKLVYNIQKESISICGGEVLLNVLGCWLTY